ncbi:hypothetical protein LWI28_016252 [Acer negundo]|uniref:Uncharacterized protein n=1 Tax=Acer negundo TaxID=4023 RepID=A0AAD5JD99_ACENE|nr:hypothetical protein LWI28_016252 [Acer negundo]
MLACRPKFAFVSITELLQTYHTFSCNFFIISEINPPTQFQKSLQLRLRQYSRLRILSHGGGSRGGECPSSISSYAIIRTRWVSWMSAKLDISVAAVVVVVPIYQTFLHQLAAQFPSVNGSNNVWGSIPITDPSFDQTVNPIIPENQTIDEVVAEPYNEDERSITEYNPHSEYRLDDFDKDYIGHSGSRDGVNNEPAHHHGMVLKRKVNGKSKVDNEESEEGEENDSSDADANSKIEKLIAQRYGKKVGSKRRVSRKRKMDDDSNSDDSGKRKKRGISKKRKSVKRGSSDSEDGDEGRRKSDESSDEEDGHWRHRRQSSRNEKGRRRSRRHSDDSDSDVSKDYGRSLSVVAAAVLGQLLRHRLFEV